MGCAGEHPRGSDLAGEDGRLAYPGRGRGNEAVFEELTWQGDVPLGLVGLPRREAGWAAASGPGSRDATAVDPRSTVLKNSDPAEDDDVWLFPCYFVRVRGPSIGFPPALLAAVVELAEE